MGVAAQLHGGAPSAASLRRRSQQWQTMWHPPFAALDTLPARHRQHAEPSWQQQQQQQQQLHVGGAAGASHVVVPLSAFGGAGLQQPVQVVMPGGQLGLLLPLPSPPPGPPTGAPAGRPQQQAGAQHRGRSVNPPSVPPPCPPPRPPALCAMRLPLKRPFHAADSLSRTQGDFAMPSNHPAAESLRKRLRGGAAKAGSGAAVEPSLPAPQPSAAVQPPPATSLPGTTLQQAAVCREKTSDLPECIRRLQRERDDSELLFLGTGAAEPSKYRGASSIHLRPARPTHAAAAFLALPLLLARRRLLRRHHLLASESRNIIGGTTASGMAAHSESGAGPTCRVRRRMASGGGVLLDAGEATWAQLVRCYGGASAAASQVAALAAVWLSHRHADHMLGLPALLAARALAAPPLLVIGHPRPPPFILPVVRKGQFFCKEYCPRDIAGQMPASVLHSRGLENLQDLGDWREPFARFGARHPLPRGSSPPRTPSQRATSCTCRLTFFLSTLLADIADGCGCGCSSSLQLYGF